VFRRATSAVVRVPKGSDQCPEIATIRLRVGSATRGERVGGTMTMNNKRANAISGRRRAVRNALDQRNKNKPGRRKSIKEIDQRPNRSSGSVSHARPSSSSAMTIDGVRQLWTASYEVHGRSNDQLVQALASATMRLALSMVCCLREGQGNAAACLQVSPRQRRYPAESRAGQPLAKGRCDRPRRSWPLETLADAATS
jgi:hypothetical protein